jgi:hypothetical protein
MMLNRRIRNVGQIADADLTFGDLTGLVGPQATGKSYRAATAQAHG